MKLTAILLAATTALTATTSFADTKSISLPGERLFPEGIAATSEGRIFVGSFIDGNIIETDTKGAVLRTFADAGSGGLVSVVGLMVDEANGVLYACSSDPGVAALTGSAAPALVSFDLESGDVLNRVELPNGGFCNDITQGADGTIYVSDSFAPRILSLSPGATSFDVWATDPMFEGEGFNLNGIAMGHTALFAVKYNSGQLFRIALNSDGSSGEIRVVETSRPLMFPDGLLHTDDGFILTEGTGAVSHFRIRSGVAQVSEITSGLNVPTSTALVGDTAYTVQSQFDHLFDPTASQTAPDAYELAVFPAK